MNVYAFREFPGGLIPKDFADIYNCLLSTIMDDLVCFTAFYTDIVKSVIVLELPNHTA